ncbi:Mur ligase [Aspergillus minisclerotigenes]|uniref:Folylpolyglutamate synthase n=1 Tax=Aspergillus minisclerotigenes TaxID=656917 RepID=A0A5N6JJ59_9EURO|nr:Mur ligase [Aspergillus minisclerotigenes]
MRRTSTFPVPLQWQTYSDSLLAVPFPAMIVRNEKPSYHDAVEKLNSTQSGYKALLEGKGLGRRTGVPLLEQMQQWVRRVGYETSDFDRLNIVHVAGTKGKGSTCAFVNSILQCYNRSIGLPRKVGLYTSPHLVTVRERIQINSEPISEEKFTKYFFEVWDALESSALREGLDPALKPSYFRFLTLMSFHVFMREGVDAAVYEVGVGGENDSTNVIVQPAVTGITTLGLDHVKRLGDTVDKIAWHKAGIFKNQCPAFTVEQVPDAMKVLEQRASEKGAQLATVHIAPELLAVDIKPAEDFQKKNASLAIALAYTALEKLGVSFNKEQGNLPKPFVEGLETVTWKGRCETIKSGQLHWHLDGAHTEDSLKVACSWFGRVSKEKELPRVLIFNQQSARDAISLLKCVHRTVYDDFRTKFQYALFCTNVTHKGHLYKVDLDDKNTDPEVLRNLTLQKELAATWHDLDPSTEVVAIYSIEEAIEYVRNISGRIGETRALVTGSFRLVGGALSILEGEDVTHGRATTN